MSEPVFRTITSEDWRQQLKAARERRASAPARLKNQTMKTPLSQMPESFWVSLWEDWYSTIYYFHYANPLKREVAS